MNDSEMVSIKSLVTSLKGWFNYLLTKWYILTLAIFVGGLCGFFYSQYKKPVYTATTSFVLDNKDEGGSLGQLAGMANVMGYNIGGSSNGLFSNENIYELYKSEKMIVSTLLSKMSNSSSELLIDRYIFYSGLKDSWRKNGRNDLLELKFENIDFGLNRLRDSVLMKVYQDIVLNHIRVEKVEKGSILNVITTSLDEVFAKELNESLVNNVNEFYIQTKIKKSSKNLEALQFKVDSVKSVMTNSISRSSAIIDATPNLNPTRQSIRQSPVQQSQFSIEMNKKILEQLVQNLEITKMTLLNETPLIQIVDSPHYPLRIKTLSALKGTVLGVFLFSFITGMFLTFKFLLKPYFK